LWFEILNICHSMPPLKYSGIDERYKKGSHCFEWEQRCIGLVRGF
jgi:hypothetical protein